MPEEKDIKKAFREYEREFDLDLRHLAEILVDNLLEETGIRLTQEQAEVTVADLMLYEEGDLYGDDDVPSTVA